MRGPGRSVVVHAMNVWGLVAHVSQEQVVQLPLGSLPYVAMEARKSGVCQQSVTRSASVVRRGLE